MSGYAPIAADEDDSEKLLHQDAPAQEWSSTLKASSGERAFRRWWPWAAHAVLLSVSLTILFTAWRTEDARCARKLSTYSPALEAVEYKDIVFDGVLDSPSEYRGPPSTAIDNAWNRIQLNTSTFIHPIRIQESDLAKFGQTKRPSLAYYQEEDGGGIYASIEVGHQLHCLDMLRQNSYVDHYGSSDENYVKRPEFYRIHIDHCIEMIRQVLMCNSDVGLLTFDWVAGFDVPFPNFSTQHKCRDFERVYDWYERNMIDLPMERMVRVGGVVDMSPEEAGVSAIHLRDQ
ncbi:uncharacterized protein C8Q71DRAFT_166840 [Rhodofomes roseus]|uniref:Tat pathway signal sequence n=1 Tax=Rhodofomes roseus TaxID=34475 RepID=A0ABQ8KAP3_9APHY|nr:uncharacterized protein C8Q71DRAFT_166840 [Rhodofomes roseus]KAH9834222.1 hypothetical protein C8Q71DRAFT_166840 [Rhodofomes roseus]